jgi:site-specific recombinase
MKSLIGMWRNAGRERIGLDAILSQASTEEPLTERLEWLVELFQWLKSPGRIELAKDDYKTGHVQATRIRYLLMLLDKQPNWKKSTSETLQSILRDTNAVNLFCATGLPSEASFFSEAVDRFMTKVLPTPPHEDDLAEVFSKLFSSVDDIQWLQRLDAATLTEIWGLFKEPITAETKSIKIGDKIKLDIEESLLFLTGQVRTYGLEPKIRMRMTPGRIQSLPFFEITFSARTLIQHLHSEDLFARKQKIAEFREVVARCRRELKEAHDHLDEFGVSVAIVYQLDRIKALLNRIEVLVRILAGENLDPKRIVYFLCNLIREVQKQRSLRSLFAENLSLISMKIAQRSAETGSHYITKTREDYLAIFSKASGGGFLTAFTALVKIIIESAKDSAHFVQGLFTSINYSVSFIWIYAAGFTLATKQPAMTANALAEKMENLETDAAQQNLVNEVVHLIRSQGAATLGNLAGVIPTALAVDVIFYFLSGDSILSPEYGYEVLEKHSALGMSPLHAAFTGVLLWLSSIIAGWVDNWSAYRELPQAIAANRRLKRILGPSRLQRWSGTYQKSLAGWSGNIALGFLLGMSPRILEFLGIPLDVRHVTLSSGVITFASAAQGFAVFMLPAFWWSIAGVLIIGIMNISVSFFLALFVALRSRRIDSSMRDTIYMMVWKRFLAQPLTFFWFPKPKLPPPGTP